MAYGLCWFQGYCGIHRCFYIARSVLVLILIHRILRYDLKTPQHNTSTRHPMITIRNYRQADAPELWQIFYHTIHTINRRDYSEQQVRAWASDEIDPAHWQQRMDSINPYIAEIEQQIVGYTDLQNDGLIDHFFCHHAYQAQGVGRALMQHVFAQAKLRDIHKLHSHVSLTAKPFYQRLGFEQLKQQQMECRGQTLQNFLMGKTLS